MARLAYGAFGGAFAGAVFAAACAGSAPAASEAPAAASPADSWHGGDAVSAPAASSAVAETNAPKCPYGELTDPHRGFVRCLTADERDAGWLPPTAQTPPAPPAPSVESDAGAPPASSGPPPAVEIGSPAFENGQVPRTEKALAKLEGAIGKCVADHGGLSAATGSMKVTFLVRVRGRAEGVEVQNARNVSSDAKDCVRLLLKNKAIGAPSADPVGVTVELRFKPR